MDDLHEQLGRLLVVQGYCTPEQVEAGFALGREKPYFRLGESLIYLGHLSIEQLDQALARQYRELRLGQLLLRKGLLTGAQLKIALAYQQEEWRLLGHLVVSLGFCTAEHVHGTLEEQRRLSPLDPEALLFED